MNAATTFTDSPPIRGTIVLDGPMINRLAHDVPLAYINPRTVPRLQSYLDILPFLARHGYRILIPETTAFFVADMLADGTDIQKYFSMNKSIDGINREAIVPFIRRVAQGHIPNISIVSDTGPEAADNFCRALHGIMSSKKAVTNKAPAYAFDRFVRSALMDVRGNPDKKEFTKEAIVSLLEQVDDRGQPLFLFTQTRERPKSEKRSEKRDAEAVTAHRLIYQLREAGLFEDIGLRAGISAEDLYRDVNRQAGIDRSETEEEKAAFLKRIESTGSRFLQSLKTLNADLDALDHPSRLKEKMLRRAMGRVR